MARLQEKTVDTAPRITHPLPNVSPAFADPVPGSSGKLVGVEVGGRNSTPRVYGGQQKEYVSQHQDDRHASTDSVQSAIPTFCFGSEEYMSSSRPETLTGSITPDVNSEKCQRGNVGLVEEVSSDPERVSLPLTPDIDPKVGPREKMSRVRTALPSERR